MSNTNDVVQPDNWYQELPRQQFSQFNELETYSSWFTAYELSSNIIAICEPCHFQEVISYLIIGSEKALLWDTGMGMFDIKSVVESFTDKELIVVNSHCHFDHVGGNIQFDKTYIYNSKQAIDRLRKGVTAEDVERNFTKDAFHYNGTLPFEVESFRIPGVDNFITIEEGHIFDLGDIQFKVLHTPGHSPDSIMIVCDSLKILFTGDTIYPASMYAHFFGDHGINSNIDTYYKVVSDLADKYSDYQLYCSHNEPMRQGSMLIDVKDAFKAIKDGINPSETDGDGFKKYQFDGFAIITE